MKVNQIVCVLLRAGEETSSLFEELRVDLYELLELFRHVAIGMNGSDRAFRLAQSAVYTLVRVDEKHVVGGSIHIHDSFVNTVNRADLDTGFIFDANTGLSDDIRHNKLSP